MANVREAMERGGSPTRQIEFHRSIPHLIKDVGISSAPRINDKAKNVSDATERLNQTENVSVGLIRSLSQSHFPIELILGNVSYGRSSASKKLMVAID
jgi:hypothetical protein